MSGGEKEGWLISPRRREGGLKERKQGKGNAMGKKGEESYRKREARIFSMRSIKKTSIAKIFETKRIIVQDFQ